MDTRKLARWTLFLVIAVGFMVALWSTNSPSAGSERISISQLATDIQNGEVSEITVDGNGVDLRVVYQDGPAQTRQSQMGGGDSLEALLANYGVDANTYQEFGTVIKYDRPSNLGRYVSGLFSFLSVALIIGFIYFMYRQAQGNSQQAQSFGKSGARLFTGESPTITFDDVAGINEAKEELGEIVEFLKEPEKFTSYGARIPKGVLLVGPPGTGKTLLAKAVSGEAGVPFFSIAGSEFVEMYVGVGASRVRDLFDQAKRHSPCIIFVDEIDAVGRQRGAGLGGGHDEREQTLNQILVEMDGFSTDTHIIMLAATNRPDILDPALLRPGRFDRRVVIDRPDVTGREQIFRVHMRGKPVSRFVEPQMLAKATPGFSGADIENAVNEGALLAARRNRPNISMDELQEAIERVQLGPERKSKVVSEEERELVAYHEGGHAVVAHFLPHALPVRKVTIVPRGPAGGVTWYLEDDTNFVTTQKMKAMLCTALGGRIAEELIFEDVTTGAANDLQRVTKIAQAMVTQYGMSDDLGLRVYGEKQEMVFLGREISEQRDYSDAIAEKIDDEVRLLIDQAYTTAKDILVREKEMLDLVAEALLEVETLNMDAFEMLMEDGDLQKTIQFVRENGVKVSADKKPNPPRNRQRPNLDLPPSPSPA